MECNMKTDTNDNLGSEDKKIETRPLWLRKKTNKQLELNAGMLVEIDKKYAIISKELHPAIVANFILIPVKTIIDDDGKKSVFDIITNVSKYKNIVIQNEKLANLNEFNKELKKINKDLFVKQNALNQILEFITDVNEKTVLGTHKTGFHNGYFVTTKNTYNKKLEVIKDVISYTNSNEYLTTNIMRSNQLDTSELKLLLQHLFKYNDPDKTLLTLCFCISCFIKTDLIKYDTSYKIPQLFIIGESGSGKTTTLTNIIQEIFSSYKSISAGMGTTKFTLIKNCHSSNFIPLMLDEYKPSKWNIKHVNTISDFLRSAYDNHVVERGQMNQSVGVFELTSPIIVVGENNTTEQALRERSVVLEYYSKDFNDDKKQHLLFLKKNKKLLNGLGYTLLKYLGTSRAENMHLISEYADKLGITESRNNTSYAILAYCFYLFEDMVSRYKITLPYTIDQVIDIFKKHYSELKNTKSELVQTLEIIDLMAENNVIEKGFDYILHNDHTLSLDIKNIYLKLYKFVKDYSIQANFLTQNIFTKSLMRESYFLKYLSVKFQNKVKKAYKIDLIKLSNEGIELEFLGIADPANIFKTM